MHARAPWLALILALLGPARAQEPPGWVLEVAPAGPLAEGEPVTLALTLRNAGAAPVLLLDCRAQAGRQQACGGLPRPERGLPLDPVSGGVLTVAVRAEEGDLGPLARAPRPPLLRGLGDQDYLALLVVAPGGSLTLQLPLAPLAALSPELLASVRAAPLSALPSGRAWAPAGPASRLPLGAEGAGQAGGPWPGPPRVELAARVWRPLGEGQVPGEEVLLSAADVGALTATEVRLTQRVELSERTPSSRQALKQAGLGPAQVEQGVFLAGAEGRPGAWLLDGPEGAWFLPAQGPAVAGPGCSLLELGATFRAGRARARLQAPPDPGLREALLAAELPCADQGKALEVTVGPVDLGRLLEVLRAQRHAVRGLAIVPLR